MRPRSCNGSFHSVFFIGLLYFCYAEVMEYERRQEYILTLSLTTNKQYAESNSVINMRSSYDISPKDSL
ncbi:hypothetical protein KL86DYS2_13186 [uncultured Dysgonomonas sp.]|uniref:Uncharacterized protein n=1 Tax=uncultured Dysgonomonas sp. TaxID=206096 RepID=A0A212K7D9_9BACT|nr:hypothetical protein KL86DYS2_13186 [uncultured Dysgonomonas sp.]